MSSGFDRRGANAPGKSVVSAQADWHRTPPAETRDDAMRRMPALADTMTTREVARAQGFTGDICSNCNGVHMQIAGHCYVCADCGSTTGCS